MIVIEPATEAKYGRTALKKTRLMRFLAQARKEARLEGSVSVLLTGDEEIRTLNRDFRNKDKSTDVLSFPAADLGGRQRLAGDLAISVDTASREATARGHGLVIELETLLLHGALHLAGYDHETDSGEMARKEELLRRKLGLSQGLIARTMSPGGVKRSARKAAAKRSRKR